jgi:hypothetical protein
VRSINQAIVVDPAPVAKEPETVPTFTVDEDGDLNIPTPPSASFIKLFFSLSLSANKLERLLLAIFFSREPTQAAQP